MTKREESGSGLSELVVVMVILVALVTATIGFVKEMDLTSVSFIGVGVLVGIAAVLWVILWD